MSSSGETDIGMGSLSTSSPTGTTTEWLLLNVTGNAGPARLPSLATSPTLAWPTSSGRVPNTLLSRIRTSLPPTLVKTTLRTVLSPKPTYALLMTSRVALIGAAAQVSTQPELVAEAAGCSACRATAAPAARATAAMKKKALRRRAPRSAISRRAPRSGIIRFGPPGETGARATAVHLRNARAVTAVPRERT